MVLTLASISATDLTTKVNIELIKNNTWMKSNVVTINYKNVNL